MKFTKLTGAWFLFAFLMLFAVYQTLAETPIWSFKGAKWYSMMETGNVMVGMENKSVAMMDGATGKQIWTRTDLGEIKEDEYTELAGTPLILFADNSGWAQRKTKLTAVDVLTGKPSGRPKKCSVTRSKFRRFIKRICSFF